ncbi:MAG: ABC-2 family transporter protein [Pirellulales bacterium]|nr:ABC-2 family transporter protein [Pirellulales bacterium]
MTLPASPAAAWRPTISARLRVWRTIFQISLAERLAYRGDFILGTLMRFLPIVTQILLWTAIFSATTQERLFGYKRDELIAYYLLTMVARAFSSMPGLASGIAKSIRDGSVKKFLTQPVDWVGFLLITRIAHKLVYYAVAALPFGLVFYLCGAFFPPFPDGSVWLAFGLSLVMSFLLGFFLEATIGMLGFWFLEISSLLFVYMLFNFFLSGHMFPIGMLDKTFLPGGISAGDVVRLLPFQYLAYFPSAVYLGKITGPALAWGLAIQAGWVVTFMIACRWAFLRGVRRYSAFGG